MIVYGIQRWAGTGCNTKIETLGKSLTLWIMYIYENKLYCLCAYWTRHLYRVENLLCEQALSKKEKGTIDMIDKQSPSHPLIESVGPVFEAEMYNYKHIHPLV